ncbi:MAG: hypothetical protein EOR16_29720 [Mesorhizobium sp.]|nr:MAG: hypothetical protein EOR16_29720 [Mesorhizobium sp.]TIP78101.1 MAG: hypothetical protein E5X60_40285 [Mesorhizobium sp.]TJV30382.1 MAG: hypothetical protein E5X87_28205 [Mesorhizobium sp.]TJW47876.1 MAG: hypothetical protein E5X59_12410 [Mesorhizobium sp.]
MGALAIYGIGIEFSGVNHVKCASSRRPRKRSVGGSWWLRYSGLNSKPPISRLALTEDNLLRLHS